MGYHSSKKQCWRVQEENAYLHLWWECCRAIPSIADLLSPKSLTMTLMTIPSFPLPGKRCHTSVNLPQQVGSCLFPQENRQSEPCLGASLSHSSLSPAQHLCMYVNPPTSVHNPQRQRDRSCGRSQSQPHLFPAATL